MTAKKRAIVAAIAGISISAILLFLSYATRNDALYSPQALGFWLTMVLRGVDSATKADYALVAIPTNGLLYALVLFSADSLRRRLLK
jgi:hypothetical protein